MPTRPGRLTIVLFVLTAGALALSVPGALRDAGLRGGIYLFSWEFLADIPKRLAGPGRFRFVMQPIMAILLGIRMGRADARSGNREAWHQALRIEGVLNLILMAVLLDVLFQWIILGRAHPVVALIVGPVLIAAPCLLARLAAREATARP